MAKAQKGDPPKALEPPAPSACWKELLQSSLDGNCPDESDMEPFFDKLGSSK